MTQEIETLPTQEELDQALAAIELFNAREADYQSELATASNSFEAYWAGSAASCALRDYRAGRFVTIRK